MFLFKKKKQEVAAAPPRPAETAERLIVDPEAEVAEADAPEAEAPAQDAALRKRRRPIAGKTRLMGYDTSDGRVVDLFDEEKATENTGQILYPVGLVMVVKGPGLGECFAIRSGMSQIGRGEDQAVRLDFGDMAISRTNHAAIVYDPADHSYLLGHGGKSNIVRLNGKPVVSTSKLKNGDKIEIGETEMRFVAICDKNFNWEAAEKTEEKDDDDDVEIA